MALLAGAALGLGIGMWSTAAVSAAEGTEGSELQVLQPEQLEVQLGADWAGVEFQLKTDAGMYPGTIPVGEDGVLRLEIGGSSSYILTCFDSSVPVPSPGETQAPATDKESNDGEQKGQTGPESDGASETGEAEEAGANEAAAEGLGTEQADGTVGDSGDTVAGIPKMHLALFGGGMVLAVGSLVFMQVMKRRRETEYGDEYDEDE